MRNNTNNTKDIVSSWYNNKFKLILDGIIVGILTGFSIVFFRLTIQKAEYFSDKIYSYIKYHLWYIPILFLVLIAIGLIIGLIVKKEPMARGSGIPQVEGLVLRKMNIIWWRVLIAKIFGGILALGAGLSMGREGPSIQIGASIGQGYSKSLYNQKIRENLLITSGASAGLAAAFNAPLAGVIFAFEEIHKNFSSLILLASISSSIAADFICSEFFGLKPIFTFGTINVLPLHYYGYLILMGIMLGVFGAFFNYSLLKSKDIYANQKWLPMQIRPIIPLMLAGIAGLFFPKILGGGQNIATELTNNNFTFKFLIMLLIFKFLFTIISYGSGAPGGIFMPLLIIGSISGDLFANILVSFFHFNEIYINNFIILAMAGYFAAIVKAPITGIVLITEMTGSFSHMLPLTIVSIVSYVISTTAGSKPIYESLLERILINKEYSEFIGSKRTKIILEVAVCTGSSLEGKKIKEVSWPEECLIIGIRRGENEIIPKGNTTINAGDYIMLLVNEENAEKVKTSLMRMADHCIIEEQSKYSESLKKIYKKIIELFKKTKKK
ncbi:MAG: ClC family H(+)/Cl(-) exchange transporter [Cyanobacteria bacterium]|nr:ClC family H(+)/Cl(-) exchange transporter [Cyanobacteriota bacterium]